MLKEKMRPSSDRATWRRRFRAEEAGTIKIHKKGDGAISILPSPPPGVRVCWCQWIGETVAVIPNHGSCVQAHLLHLRHLLHHLRCQ
ncbi:formin-like protein 2 isoform X1 [Lates japonicus]|uniref:Formin-like protein 2 isoform X1 n=1 Tax=Lates japonicus TaxID=270547 RepID=A0AAD3MDA5_LATJO|nr:formin-like protein 2 isoform X1 [Lates japonicus]